MGGLKDRMRTDLTSAMRSRDAPRTAALRMALTAVREEEVAGAAAHELSDEQVRQVLTREVRKRRESADAFAGAGRAERAARERAAVEVLTGYCRRSFPTRSSPRSWTGSSPSVGWPARRRWARRCGRSPLWWRAVPREAGWPRWYARGSPPADPGPLGAVGVHGDGRDRPLPAP